MSNRIDRYSKHVTLALILAIIGSGCNPTAIPPAQPAPTASRASTILRPTETMVHTPIAGEDTPATTVPDHTEPMPAPKGVLYQDDFTDPNSGWPNGIAFDNYYIGYHEPSFYHVEVHVPRDKAVINLPQQRFDDFTVESKLFVEPNNTAQDGDFRYGLLFRRSGSQYYAFTISPRTKTWYVLKSSPTGLAELKQGHDDSIQGLTAADTLRVDAKGSTFFFHINDQPIDQISDPDYTSGEVGFYVETFDSPRVHIHYDTLTVREVETSPPQEGLLYQDDFTDPNSGWPNGIAFDNYYIGYHEPSFYHVEVHVPRDKAVINLPQQRFDDFTVESKLFVEPNNTAQDGDFRYGLLFRRSGSQYYAFTISPRTKTWYVLKSSPTGLAELKQGHDDSIQGLTAADTLRVDAKGSTFFFHINDQPIDQISDPDYTSGEVGFYVETFDSPRVHIHYDSLAVHEVEAPKLLCSVVVSGLNLREGPGTTYTIIGSATRDTQLVPLGRSADGSWIHVRVADTQQLAWVSSAAIYVSCNMPVNDLPVREP